MDSPTSSTNSATFSPSTSTSMLGAYLYDTSSIQDRLLQPQTESAAQRVARLERLLSTTASILPTSTNSGSSGSRL
ncbi:hypothetical protein QBC34DRAFT_379117 [Podospora aff. communis PSN243]|uniref:Uncharacterized protein n=1 Tax=Podospora aff. communis PSN243 TaxID=3040156 RepID=A0AAV9GRK2_9PEZI|nr:hypothetical protein QBC34DRAFT_379117 [Podospora aff. communis PSN243]